VLGRERSVGRRSGRVSIVVVGSHGRAKTYECVGAKNMSVWVRARS